MRRFPAALAFLLLVMLASCGANRGAGETPPSSQPATDPVSTPEASRPETPPTAEAPRVAVVVLENRGFADVVHDPSAPFIAHLASTYALATNFHAIAHPSLPNYLALIGGSAFGVRTNTPHHLIPGENLVDQLEAAGLTWTAYIEGLPSAGSAVLGQGLYAKKHNPFMYFDDIAHNRARRNHVVPLARLSSDISRGSLPDFVWITPDLCDDGHDCELASVNAFLVRGLPSLMRALGPNGVLMITWDEAGTDDNSTCCGLRGPGGGHIATIVAGPGAAKGVRSHRAYNHYSMLRTIEAVFGLEPLRAAAGARAMTDLLD